LIEDRLGERARVYGTERAILVRLDTGGTRSVIEDSLVELESLADTAGIPILATVIQKRQRPSPATFIGKGKVAEVKAAAAELSVDAVIFGDDLTPAQARNLEESLGRKVIDRTQLIMDIFAQRAATKEARLQVELAQLRYLLPRLRGWGMSLTRTGGGIGTRGPGETQLEIDRNKIRLRIHALERQMAKAAGERGLRRKQRELSDLPQIALVGYTNSGKSTLLNRFCAADVLVEDKLFSTLDTKVRRGHVSSGRSALFIDTVGFIRALPHHLVPAFAATLEAARYADVILHVVDLSSPNYEADYQAVVQTLEDEVFHEGEERPTTINVLNKVDAVSCGSPARLDGIAVSAREGINIEALLERIAAMLFPDDRLVEFVVPFEALGVFHSLDLGERAVAREFTDCGARFSAVLSQRERDVLQRAGAVPISGDASLGGGR